MDTHAYPHRDVQRCNNLLSLLASTRKCRNDNEEKPHEIVVVFGHAIGMVLLKNVGKKKMAAFSSC